jgi:DNA-binding NarL/FixJ family response regulator
MNPTRVLIVDDHTVVRKGIQMIFKTEPDIQVVGEAEDGNQAFRLVRSLRPDVVLMDLVMPKSDGIEAIVKIKCDFPSTKIIVLTTFEDEVKVRAAMEANADGYLLKDADDENLLRAIRHVQRGEMPLHPCIAHQLVDYVANQVNPNNKNCLTHREQEVLQLIARGLSNKAVANALHICEGTVKTYVGNILDKLNVSSRTEAAMRATQLGIVATEEAL